MKQNNKIMNRIQVIVCCILMLGIGTAEAQNRKTGSKPREGMEQPQAKLTNREYSIIVYERDSNSPLSFDREISKGRSGFWGGIFDVYRNTFAGKVTNLSSNILGIGVGMVIKAFTQKQDNQRNWYSAMQREMTYSRKLPMQTEIADFYKNVSEISAMDPEGMMFDGLGCRQYITYTDDNGEIKKILVFEVACSLDDSQVGKQRILHHGKFQIKVDSIRFNPYLCDLPNDSLTASQVDEALRVPFDFERRRNLTFRLNATLTSSWMNEAIEIFKDQELGQFQVEFTIPDSTALDAEGKWKGYFTYDARKDYQNTQKNVKVNGECFIVPRTYIGTYKNDDYDVVSQWGTGQYRVDMNITETCQMNDQYYQDEEKWKEEWKKVKKRRHSRPVFNTFIEQAKTEFDVNNYQWVHTILDPVSSAILVDEQKWINNLIIGAENSSPASYSAPVSSVPSGMGGGGVMPSGKPGKK